MKTRGKRLFRIRHADAVSAGGRRRKIEDVPFLRLRGQPVFPCEQNGRNAEAMAEREERFALPDAIIKPFISIRYAAAAQFMPLIKTGQPEYLLERRDRRAGQRGDLIRKFFRTVAIRNGLLPSRGKMFGIFVSHLPFPHHRVGRRGTLSDRALRVRGSADRVLLGDAYHRLPADDQIQGEKSERARGKGHHGWAAGHARRVR